MGQEEELLRIAKKLEKMVARKNTEGALDLLKKLNSCQMSIQLLQTTRIGVAVNGVRKHCSDKEVVSLAKVLIKNWKRLLDSPGPPKGERGEEREKAKKKEKAIDCSDWKPEAGLSPPRKKREEPKDRRDSVDSKSSATSSPKRPSMERSNSSKSKAETPRTPSSPSSPTFAPSVCLLAPCYLTGDSVRDKCVEMLSAALKAEDDYKDYGVNCDKMASEIEDHIYQELKSTDMKYRNRVRSRISNLKDPRNPGLRRNVLSRAISAGLIAKMTAEEMASDELRELRNAMTQEAIREHQMAKTGGTTTDLFQCSKCKKKNCTYNQVQTRSADEPMTTFVLCNECGNRWKVCIFLPLLSFTDAASHKEEHIHGPEGASYMGGCASLCRVGLQSWREWWVAVEEAGRECMCVCFVLEGTQQGWGQQPTFYHRMGRSVI
uniref:Transcription elongation factor A protein 3 n=1 Tax=Equus asinus asinus TaxID=83772 RepID=A0A8C4L8L9_EQUAS